MAGENLDLSSDPGRQKTDRSRRYIGVNFACCGCYTRVYVNRDETAYEGRCPRCARPVRVLIAAGGTDSRFFTAH